MNCEGSVRFEFPHLDEARRVFGALHADDDDFCTTRLEGNVVVALLRGDSPRSLLRALDDLLSCASVAEDVINEPDMGADDAGH